MAITYRYLGELLCKMGEYEEALINIDKAISIEEKAYLDKQNINIGHSRYIKGNILYELESYNASLEEFELVNIIYKDNPSFADKLEEIAKKIKSIKVKKDV